MKIEIAKFLLLLPLNAFAYGHRNTHWNLELLLVIAGFALIVYFRLWIFVLTIPGLIIEIIANIFGKKPSQKCLNICSVGYCFTWWIPTIFFLRGNEFGLLYGSLISLVFWMLIALSEKNNEKTNEEDNEEI